MAEWNKNKVEPSAINGGQEFTKKDNLAVNELNAIVNNSFFASEKAERAEKLAENAVRGNGTLVTIGGQVQGEWSADFAESERQKSKNLFNVFGDCIDSLSVVPEAFARLRNINCTFSLLLFSIVYSVSLNFGTSILFIVHFPTLSSI